jgi:AmiR/NasT family two-component response regulator
VRHADPVSSQKIVVVDSDPNFRRMARETLEKHFKHQVIGEAGNGTDMVRTVLAVEPDVVVFETHLPRLNGLDALREIRQERLVAGVAITSERDLSLLCQALKERVLAYLLKPFDTHQLGSAVAIAASFFRELSELTATNESLRQNLENRKIIERAKGVLMKRHRYSEADAFRRLQRGAMNRRTSMIQIAQAVLNGEQYDL